MKKIYVLLIAILLILSVSLSVNVVLAMDKYKPTMQSKDSQKIDKNSYQIIFLNSTDRQIYIGKLSVIDSNTYYLTKVYYFSEERNKLTKLGDEDTKPQDSLVIPKCNVLYWENLQNANQFGGVLK
jgi:hypothetical protein